MCSWVPLRLTEAECAQRPSTVLCDLPVTRPVGVKTLEPENYCKPQTLFVCSPKLCWTVLVPCCVPLGVASEPKRCVVRFTYRCLEGLCALCCFTKAYKKRNFFFPVCIRDTNMIKRPLQRGYRGYDKWPCTITGNFFFRLAELKIPNKETIFILGLFSVFHGFKRFSRF